MSRVKIQDREGKNLLDAVAILVKLERVTWPVASTSTCLTGGTFTEKKKLLVRSAQLVLACALSSAAPSTRNDQTPLGNNEDLRNHLLWMTAHPGYHDNETGYGHCNPFSIFGT